ncbi:ATP-grasp domain-containing protein [Actinoplanes solisilvae]|uniref:ATP-grasp domain-containing protein n=1 Tax=Actinoplanes solisilvae TaxID=2486853 RepID=UPI000FDB786D|nr:ATP-grasp domain-containing protein [Actinoplanes solisilvae]
MTDESVPDATAQLRLPRIPRLAVVLDFGSATPMSILASARGLADIIFLCDRDLPYIRALIGELREIATVCDITGLGGADLVDLVERLDLDGITTFSESRLNVTADLAQWRDLPYLSVATARALTDKYIQRRILADAGVQATRCRVVHDVADLGAVLAEVGLPAILKPRNGAASAYTCRVDTPAEAAARLGDFLRRRSVTAAPMPAGNDFVVEEMLVGDPTVAGAGWGDYVSVESVTSHGVVHHVEITGKFPLADPLRETGYVVPCTLADDVRRQVLALTEAGILALKVQHGTTHVEVKLTPYGPRIIEVNGRLGGYVADIVSRARGIDLVRATLAAALGRAADVPPAAYRRHAFQYFITPPMPAVALRRLDGAAELGAHRGIQIVETFKRVGERLDWRHGTLTYLGIVHGVAHDHAGVLRLVDLVDRTLQIEYETAPASP